MSASSASASSGSDVVLIGKRVTPPTSCSWQQVTDGIKCYIEPRTCYDCLNTELANGNKCTLTPFGLCASMSEYDYTQDYRRGGPAGGFPIHYNYFPETNTTYCEANDTLCNSCKSSTFALDDNNPSTYCEGKNNCVCVKICESDSWRNETLERLRTVMAERNEIVNATCPIATNSSTSASSSASGSNEVSSVNIFTTPIRKNVYASEDTCRWYQNQTFCDIPRSCYDCLNVPLYSGQKCTINPAGYCASISEYDYMHDYRVRKSAGAAHYFPSTNTTYCEANDAVCQKCKETTFKESITGVTNPTQYCVGANGCVCVAFCESANWKAIVKDATCSASVVVSSNGQFSVATIALMMIGFTLAFTGAIQLLTIVRTRRAVRRQELLREQRRAARERRGSSGLAPLQLDGWKSMCEDLISKEREFVEHVAGERRAVLTHGDGPTVVVEEGDGYRPISPSRTTTATGVQ